VKNTGAVKKGGRAPEIVLGGRGLGKKNSVGKKVRRDGNRKKTRLERRAGFNRRNLHSRGK